MDGHALGPPDRGTEDNVLDRVVRTGEAVPGWSVRVVPHEEYVPARDMSRPPASSLQSNIIYAGQEYSQGEILVRAGTLLLETHLASLRVLGISQVEVLTLPEVRVIRFGNQPAGVATSGWVCGFARAWGATRVTEHTATDAATLAKALGGDLSVVVSDAAPGRYDAIKTLLLGGIHGLEPGFWKVDVNPCKHIGFGLFSGSVPVLAFPDLFYKTVMSCTVFLAPLLERLSGVSRHSTAARWEGDTSEPGHYPMAVPVELRGGAWGAEAVPVSGDTPFSARKYLSVAGFCLLWRRVRRGDAVQVDPLLGSGTPIPSCTPDAD
jgi:molybdopterin molybdotransferase